MEEKRAFRVQGYEIPRILIGTNHMGYEQLKDVCQAAIEEGIFGFDTSPNYLAEGNLKRIIREMGAVRREQMFIQDKIDNQPLIFAKGNVGELVKKSLKELGVEYIDSILIHWPTPGYFEDAYQQLEELQSQGLVRMVGVSNFRERHLQKLTSLGVKRMPVFNQIERHPLRTVEKQMKFHEEWEIITQAYAPLCRMIPEISKSPVIVNLSRNYGKTEAQIILRWHIQQGVIPVFKSQNPTRIHENCDVFDFSLTDSEMEEISALNMDYKFHIESVCCPGF